MANSETNTDINADIMALLNALLQNKLAGINQYFLHARMLKHKGRLKLADYEYKASIDSMKHADMLVEHILSQGGLPQMHELGQLRIGRDEPAMLRGDLAHAEETLALLDAILEQCRQQKDDVTGALLSRIREGQREQVEFIHSQINSSTAKECA